MAVCGQILIGKRQISQKVKSRPDVLTGPKNLKISAITFGNGHILVIKI